MARRSRTCAGISRWVIARVARRAGIIMARAGLAGCSVALTTGRGYDENKHSTDVVSPRPPPRACMRIIEKKHSDDVESPPPPPRACMSVHHEGKSRSDLGPVLVLNGSPDRTGRPGQGSSGGGGGGGGGGGKRALLGPVDNRASTKKAKETPRLGSDYKSASSRQGLDGSKISKV